MFGDLDSAAQELCDMMQAYSHGKRCLRHVPAEECPCGKFALAKQWAQRVVDAYNGKSPPEPQV